MDFTSESRFAGSRVVIEAKDREGMTQKKALDELAAARQLRGAQVGVFVLSSMAVGERSGFPAFARCGCDILVQWHPDEPASDAYLHAAVLLAMALAARLQQGTAVDELKEIEALEKGLTTHLQRLEGLQKKAAKLQTLADEMVRDLSTGVGEARGLADGIKGLLRSARAEQAGDIDFGEDSVTASNQLGPEGMALPAA
ncbi:hypothetical protein [Nannocystis sp.]|uniref:hypothetical protein n=1 Tax=Nannocystis sp. TaxID=1962667 RepID=UPI0025DA8C37|nr:hypothetical protein [Nannocystis sp.]MBK7829349.1 hypothetical protein [Nannocystis sp.]